MRRLMIRKELLGLMFLLWASVSFGGCVYLVIGSVGALGGYAISTDTVQGTLEREKDDLWEASLSVVNIMGRLTRQDESEGKIEAIVNGARVTVTIDQFTSNLVRLTVKARKSFFPSIATAQDVYIKIINEMGK